MPSPNSIPISLFRILLLSAILPHPGWAYDLKTVSNPMICKRALRTGDGSYNVAKHKSSQHATSSLDPTEPLFDCNGNELPDFPVNHDSMLWGWNDKDLPEAAKQCVDIHSPQKKHQ